MRKLPSVVIPAVVLAAALWARLVSWPLVYGGREPQLVGDSDAHYHVLRTERWLVGGDGAPWTDPALNWPHGADVPWPPLLDAIIASSARAVLGPVVERSGLVAVAAVLPVVLGLLLVALTAALGRRALGSDHGWIAAAIVAVVPAGVDPSLLGRVDQHALESVLLTALLLAFVAREAPRRSAVAGSIAAVLVTLAFWAWMGSALHLGVLAAAAAVLHVVPRDADGPRADRGALVLAIAGLGGAGLLAATVAALGRPGALGTFTISGVGGLHVALAAGCGSFAALLHVARARRPVAPPARRLGEVAIAAAVPVLALLLAPAVRAGIGGGLTALAAANPWYAAISEFQPLLGKPAEPLADELAQVLRGYGLSLFVAPLAAPALVARWRRDPGQRPALLAVSVVLVVLVAATLLRRRFGVYAIVPIAIAAELGIRYAIARAGERVRPLARPALARIATAAGALLAVAPSFVDRAPPPVAVTAEQRRLLEWIGTQPARPGSECVLAPWDAGHVIQYFASRPVVASPFGTEGGAGALDAAAAVWFATDTARAEAALAGRRCGLVLLGNVPLQTSTLFGFAPPGAPRPFDVPPALNGGSDMAETRDYWRLVPVRLYYQDGAPAGELPSLDAFRLLAETSSTAPLNPAMEEQWKLFERVPGARLVVRGPPGAAVRASIALRANTGRPAEWFTTAEVGRDGAATLRLPYASGTNGLTRGGAWTVTVGDQGFRLVVDEGAVREGRAVVLETTRPAAVSPP